MYRLLVPAIAVAIASASLAAAEPAQPEKATPPANCPYMQDGHPMHQAGGPNAMQHHMGTGPATGQGQMMQHGDHHAMGDGAQHGHNAEHMQGQAMPHGDHSAMGQGPHHGMMQGDGQCPALDQQGDGK